MNIKVLLTLTEELLGTKPSDPNIFDTVIASKAPDDDKRKEELETTEKQEQIGTTVFSRVNGQIGIWDYQIKGFFKDACSALNRCDKEERNNLEKLTAFKTKIDGVIFVFPRFIPIIIPAGLTTGMCERPIRVDTAQGPRVAVVRSESIPAGSELTFEVKIMARELHPYVEAWFGYGALRGLGQWRNGSKGRFTWTDLTAKA